MRTAAWQEKRNGEPLLTCEYGHLNESQIEKASQGIKIPIETPETDPDSPVWKAQKIIEECKRVYFIGFAYHKHNLERLAPGGFKKDIEVRGTAYNEGMMMRYKAMGYFHYNQREHRTYFADRDVNCLDFFLDFVSLD